MLQCNRRIQLLIVEFPQDYIDVLDFAKVTPETKHNWISRNHGSQTSLDGEA